MLDLDTSRRFREYRKGNKQKVGLVVALQHKPDLLILDEPTSGLDPLVQQTFFGLVREARDGGPHDLPLVAHHRRGRPDLRPGGDHPRGPARPGRLDRGDPPAGVPPRRADVRAPVAPAVFEGLPGVSDVEVEGHVVTMRVSGPIGAVVRPRPRTGSSTSVSREPNLEDVFLAQYGDHPIADGRPMTTDARALARPEPDRADRRPRLRSTARPSATAGGRRSSSVAWRRCS